MPAKPIELMASASHTGLRLKSRSSRMGLLRGSLRSSGRKIATSKTVSSAIRPTRPNAQRQLSHCPSQVAMGLPISMAMVSPASTRLTALARWSAGTIEAATSMATPKYAPWGRPAMKRNTINE